MCMMIYAPKGKTIPTEHIRRSMILNPHGVGIMWRSEDEKDKGTIKARWQMNSDDIEGIMSALAGHELVFHARAGTGGTIHINNVHPFPINFKNGERWFMAHNGGFDPEQVPIIDRTRSDTWHLSQMIQQKGNEGKFDLLSILTNDVLLQNFEHWLGPWNKLCFAGPHGFYIVNELSGYWYDGMWYSNDMLFQRAPRLKSVKPAGNGYAATVWVSEYPQTTNLKPPDAAKVVLATLMTANSAYDCALEYALRDPQPLAIVVEDFIAAEKAERANLEGARNLLKAVAAAGEGTTDAG